MQDINWYYSALAQSAAAIIGIMSALIISRIFTISGEKLGLKNKINVMTKEIQNLRKEKKPITAVTLQLSEVTSWNENIDLKINLKDNLLDELNNQFYSLSFPKHIKIGIFILIFSTFTCVIWPLWILLLSNSSGDIKLGAMVLFIFVVCIIAIFSYILLEMESINAEDTT